MIVWGRREPVEFSAAQLRYVEQREHFLTFYLTGGRVWRRKGKLNDLEPLLVFPLSQELPGQSEFRPEHRQRANGIPNEGGRKRLHSPGNLLPGQGRLGELAVHIGAGKGGSE